MEKRDRSGCTRGKGIFMAPLDIENLLPSFSFTRPLSLSLDLSLTTRKGAEMRDKKLIAAFGELHAAEFRCSPTLLDLTGGNKFYYRILFLLIYCIE